MVAMKANHRHSQWFAWNKISQPAAQYLLMYMGQTVFVNSSHYISCGIYPCWSSELSPSLASFKHSVRLISFCTTNWVVKLNWHLCSWFHLKRGGRKGKEYLSIMSNQCNSKSCKICLDIMNVGIRNTNKWILSWFLGRILQAFI